LMTVAAHNVGGPEAALGADYLRRVAATLHVPFVSANVHDATGPVGWPIRVTEAGGRRIGITGVLSRRYAAAGLTVDEPRDAILHVASKYKGGYDSLIVLAYTPEDELRALAASLP